MENSEHTRFESIRSRLQELGLFNDDSRIMLKTGAGSLVLDAAGTPVQTDFFASVDAPMAVFTSGSYSQRFAAAARTIHASNEDMAMMFGPRVRCAGKPGGKSPACIIPGKGFVVTARFENELVAACILMEKMCMTELLSPKLGGFKKLKALLCRLEHAIYLKKYSRNSAKAAAEDAPAAEPVPADVPDLEARLAVIEYGKQLVENRLIQATWGNVSVRLDEDRFLITPSGVDYDRIRPEEVVEVRISDGSYAEGLHPSSERKLHQLVYRERPDAGAVIHTHSAVCQIYAACHSGLRTGSVDYPCAPYAISGSGKLAENVAAVMKDHNGCIMSNHGFVAAGETLEQTLARLKEAENLAKATLEE